MSEKPCNNSACEKQHPPRPSAGTGAGATAQSSSSRLDMTEISAESLQDLTELVEQLNVEKPRPTSTNNDQIDIDSDADDFWGADGDLADDLNDGFNIGESKSRHRQMHSIGYLEGITAGKQASAQEGFNTGFKQSVHVGYKLGLARGISSTLSSLPDQLKEQLLGAPENKDRLQSLHQSLKAMSSNDAQIRFYDGIREAAASQPHDHSELNCQDASIATKDLACNQLEFLYKELKLLTSQAPDIKVNFEFGQERIE